MAQAGTTQQALHFPSLHLAVSISALVAALLFLGTSMHYGWRYHLSVVHMLFFFQGVHYAYPLTQAAMYLQRVIFLWALLPVAVYFVFRMYRQFSFKRIENVNALGVTGGVLLINLFVGGYLYWESTSLYDNYKYAPPPKEELPIISETRDIKKEGVPEKQAEVKKEPRWKIWQPELEKMKLTLTEERAKSLLEMQTKSVSLLLDWAALMITGILVVFVKDLGILFSSKKGEDE